MKNAIKRFLKWIFKGIPTYNIKANVMISSPSRKLEGKKILITGGGRGLGYYIAEKCIKEGARVLICGRNIEVLKQSAKQLNCQYLKFDMADIRNMNELINETNELLGGLDCLINNAGISLHEKTLHHVTEEGFDKQFNTNLKGPYFLSQAFISFIEKNNIKGNIIFISSERGMYCDMIPYGLTKVAINSLTQGLGRRYSSKNLRVNAIAPGVTASDMTGVDKNGNLYREDAACKRVFIPEEVAEITTFLLSDYSDCITGQIIPCNRANHLRCDWK